jgi:hypothetical protein
MVLSAATLATQMPVGQPLDHIDQVLVFDELGFECVPEERIDAAFHLTGKGVRMPRTCLPDPCKAALSPRGLADLIGRPATPEEWDEYYGRYGDRCLAEVTPFGVDDRLGGASTRGAAPEDFWAPFIVGAPVDFVPTESVDDRPFVPTVPGISSVFGPRAGPFLSGGSTRGGDDDPTTGGGTGGLPPLGNLFAPEDEDDPTPEDDTSEPVIINSAPLPGSLVAFLSALAGAGFFAARAKRKNAA